MEIEEFIGLVHLTEKLGLITPPIAEEVLAHTRSVNGNFIDPKILVQNNHLTAWQIGKIIAGDGTMLLFNGYQLLSPIGLGNLGRTYKAKKIDTGEIVALKVLRKRHTSNNPETLKFLRQ
jgi:serine/threonine-protein kinase